MTQLATRAASSCFGSGEWRAYTVGRGGSPVRFELEHTAITQTKVLNGTGSASVNIPNVASTGSSCCEVLAGTVPWRDELLLYRDRELAFVGPIPVRPTAGLDGGQIRGNDLFHWMGVRLLEEDFHGDGDVADIFASIFALAYEKDDSPNISISTRQTGVQATRDFKGVEFRKAFDVLTELARTGLDFTMDGRRLLAGGAEIFLADPPLILHDEGCISADIVPEGDTFATDVAIFGSTQEAGGMPVTGRATRATSVYGLVQRTITELTIADRVSADANALARLEAMQPEPLRLTVVLSPDAAFGFGDLIPGRQFDVRLTKVAGCIEVMQLMRLEQVDVNVSVGDGGASETVSLGLIPVGVTN